MIDILVARKSELVELCRRYAVKRLEVFGSGSDGTFDPQRSDLDFLIEFLPEAALKPFAAYFDLKEDLERLVGRSVDLVMPGAIRNRFLREAIERQREVVYAA